MVLFLLVLLAVADVVVRAVGVEEAGRAELGEDGARRRVGGVALEEPPPAGVGAVVGAAAVEARGLLEARFAAEGEARVDDEEDGDAEEDAEGEAAEERVLAVAARGDEVVGSSFLKPNQPRPGAHVANCGCATAADSTGLGVGRAMCLESMKITRIRGFRAIQFDLVLTPNPRAVRLWRDLGFQKIGRVPMAHR